MCPARAAIIAGKKPRVTRTRPTTFVSTIPRRSSSFTVSTGSRPRAPPALPDGRRTAAAQKASMLSAERTSSGRASARGAPASRQRWATSRNRS